MLCNSKAQPLQYFENFAVWICFFNMLHLFNMKFTILSTLLICTVTISAQKINKDYTFLPQENGNLYFIMPQKGFRTQDRQAKKGLVYDITYLSLQDSATVNYTYNYQTVCLTDSLYVLDNAGRLLYAVKNEMLYTQPKKNYWVHRGTVNVPYPLLQTFYQSASPIQLVLVSPNGQRIVYMIKPSKWVKHSKMMQRIFNVIDLNH